MFKHPTVIAAVIGAVAMIAVALIGLWGSSTEPTTAGGTIAEPPAEPDLAVAASSSDATSVDFKSCEKIDRSGKDTLSRTIFDIQDKIVTMMAGDYTSYEINNYLRQYDRMRIIDCGYVQNVYAPSDGEIWTTIERSPEGRYGRIFCYFGDEWESKLRTLDRNTRIAFVGVVDDDYRIIHALYLRDCSILQVG